MPSNPFVALSAPAKLGATLLGVSASLLALDVTGTVVLDRSRAADVAARASVATAASPVTPAATALPNANSPRIAPPAAPAPHVAATAPHIIAPRHVVLPHTGTAKPPVVALLARHTSVTIGSRHVPGSTSESPPLVKYAALQRPIVVAQTRRTTPSSAVERTAPMPQAVAAPRVAVVALAAPQPARGTQPSRRGRPIASLRDVRRFVIRELRARDRRVCAISATAYTAPDGHVVVDLVLRSRKSRWSEKAVVRRSGTDLKLLGVKARELPYWTIAASGVVPGP